MKVRALRRFIPVAALGVAGCGQGVTTKPAAFGRPFWEANPQLTEPPSMPRMGPERARAPARTQNVEGEIAEGVRLLLDEPKAAAARFRSAGGPLADAYLAYLAYD